MKIKQSGFAGRINKPGNNIYHDNGYQSRNDYLRHLAEEYEVSLNDVHALADLLGPSEDFDGLVCAVQDQAALDGI